MKYQNLAATHIGHDVTVNGFRHTITKLSDQEGKLKNGLSVPYVILTSALGNEAKLHPRKAYVLFSKGEVEGIKLLVDAVAATLTSATQAPTSEKKKQAMIRIFNEVVNAKGTRQEVIQRFMKETGASLNCSNTYYQSVRGGKAGWQ